MKKLLLTLLLILFLTQTANAGLFSRKIVQNPLTQAVELGNVKYVKKLIKNGHAINAVDANGQTALMRASFAGNERMIKILIRAGADVNIADKNGYTALHIAVRNGHEGSTKILVKRGAVCLSVCECVSRSPCLSFSPSVCVCVCVCVSRSQECVSLSG